MSNLDVAELDFSTIKTNLINFLQSQEQFKDYDFNGSNLSVIIDLLSYNTHTNAYYLNMVSNEMFLDTAVLRDSVLSHAKTLNYIPRSYRSSEATVDIKVIPTDDPNTITIPKHTKFRTLVDFAAYEFLTAETIVVSKTTDYTASSVSIYEGEIVEEIFTVDTTIDGQRFILSNEEIDTTSIEVTVKDNAAATIETSYEAASSLLGLSSSSKVFFISSTTKDKYEVNFGDGIYGLELANGNEIKISYRIAEGEAPNGAAVFNSAAAIQGYSNVEVTTITSALGGAAHESIESIKFNAPKYYQVRERAVTSSDYEILLKQQFPEIEAISVYGGETLSPPKYGTVAISVDIANTDGIPDTKKQIYDEFISEKASVGTRTVFVDPEFLNVEVTSDVKYNINSTSASENDIKSIVIAAISAFNTAYLGDFNKTFKFSRLTTAVDAADNSIVSNDMTVRPYYEFSPSILTTTSFTLDYAGEIDADTVDYSITSSGFTYENSTSSFSDDGLGNIIIVTSTSDSGRVVVETIGTVDYTTGVVKIDNFQPQAYTGDGIKLYVRMIDKDIAGSKNKIVNIPSDTINISTTQVRE